MNTWVGLPAGSFLGILLLLFATGAALLAWLAFRSPVRDKVRSLTGIADSVFASTAVLFSLLAGFLASDMADRNHRAWVAVNTEAGAVATLYALSRSEGAATIAGPLKRYAEAVVTDEWPKMAQSQHSAHAETALHALMRHASDPAMARETSPAVQTALISAVLTLGEARGERLALAFNRTSRIQWVSVLVLGLVTQLCIALVHLERPRAHVAAAAVFALSVIVALWPIALQEQPFAGALSIAPSSLERAVSQFATTS
ncbi:DUF4239 domain-containing protein [Rhodoplanes serenus]|uniref:DUF4239 domain-containing protein n=1 Tax=Rhodoplanes serenus TaxID=200615 RepID=A0A327K0Q8_9BRAD|nr:DUF4239 domain-containing protein [Rhodoplanes serenus]MTW15352.1 DUF4239 domain-containing protein [Rhodoplanes serenus]RAI31325.1 hypothetical protein CH340_18990 [Rhodoplanes serenus]